VFPANNEIHANVHWRELGTPRRNTHAKNDERQCADLPHQPMELKHR
jgi:hypothetical protein